MHKEVTVLSTGNRKSFGWDEQAVMALLLVCGVMQIGAMVSASADVAKNSHHTALLAQPHDGTLLARR